MPFADGYTIIELGVLPLLLLFSFSGLKDQVAQQGVYVEFQYGLRGVIIGYLASIAGGVIYLRE